MDGGQAESEFKADVAFGLRKQYGKVCEAYMRDMTVGPAQGHLWKFAMPVLLGNWLQLAYHAVDSIIAGRFIGKEEIGRAHV